MKKAVFLYNPASGNRMMAGRLDEFLSIWQKSGLRVTPIRLWGQESIAEILRSEPWELVLVGGGDGTFRSVAQALYDTKTDLPLGGIPGGTCNNFLTNLGYPQDLLESAKIVARQAVRRVDLALVNERQVFLSTLAAGAFVTSSYQTNGRLKERLGPLAYYLHGANELATLAAYPVAVRTPREDVEQPAYLVLVTNGASVGNFADLLSDDLYRMDDGQMELILVKESGVLDLAAALLTSPKIQSEKPDKRVHLLRSEKFVLEGPPSMPVSLDGEEGLPMPLRVQILNKGLQVIFSSPEKESAL